MVVAPYNKLLSPLKFRLSFTIRVYAYIFKFLGAMRKKAQEKRVSLGKKMFPKLKFEDYQRNTFDVYTWYTCRMVSHLHAPRLPDYDSSANVVIGELRKYQSSSNERRFPDQPETWIPRGQPRYFPFECNLCPEQDQGYLTPLDLSIALTRIYKWTTAEVERFLSLIHI